MKISEVHQLVEQAKEGETDVMEAYGKLKTFADSILEAADSIKQLALDEALKDRIEQDKISRFGYTFSYVKPRSMYNYSGISTWRDAENERKRIEEISKTAAKQNVEIMDLETGEIIPPCIITYSKEGLSVKLDK